MKNIFTLLFALTAFCFGAFAQCPNSATAPNNASIIFLPFSNATAASDFYTTLGVSPGDAVTFSDANGNSITATLTTSGNASKLRLDITSGTRPDPLSFDLGPCSFVAGAVLPVSLSSFTAKKAEKSVLLSWETEMEINNDYFVVERSIDGKDFEELAKIAGEGNSEELVAYNFEDKSPKSATNYYRLRQVDYDGTESFSEIVSVKFKDTHLDLNLYPTVVREELNIDLTNLENENVTINILDVRGQLLVSQITNSSEIITLNLADLNLREGMYYVRCQSIGQTTTGKFLVVK